VPSSVQLAGTGLPVVGRHARSVQSVLEDLISQARREVMIAAYTIGGNLGELLDLLQATAARGVNLRIVLNRFYSQPGSVQRVLLELGRKFSHVETFSYEGDGDLHMKVVVADRRRAILGSANLTWRGLTENLELCVFIEGRLARIVAEILDDVIASSKRLIMRRDT